MNLDVWAAAIAGEIVAVDDTESDPRIASPERFAAVNIRSFVAIPLRRHHAWRHVMMLARAEPRPWREEEIQFARELTIRCWTRVERLRAEIELGASEQRLRLILENAREYAIIAMDLDRRIILWSEGAQRLLGYAEEEMRGRSGDDVFTPEDQAALAPRREAETALRDGRASNERWHVRKDGTRFWGSGAMMVMRDGAGEIQGLLKIMRDHTDVRLAQEALLASQTQLQDALALTEQARAEAEAAGRAKDRFLAALSHELRTPLNPVLMISGERATDETLAPELRDEFATIQHNIEHEARLIDDMLDLSPITRGKLSLHTSEVDLHALLEEVLAIVHGAAREKELTLSSRCESPRATVKGDPARLKQIFLNLLNNAIKFTPRHGAVTLRTERPAGTDDIQIEITDTGLGLTEEELAKAFEAFTQGSHATNGSSYGGLGLGLAIARELVEGHHGRIAARSLGRGRGATFTVTLPLALDAASSQPLAPPAQAVTGQLRILVVDDHTATRQALQRMLAHRHHHVVAAGSKSEALAAAAKEPFDLLISDVGLPDGDGNQLMAELHAAYPKLPGIALTGYGMEADVARSTAAGFSRHLTKPVVMAQLHRAIAETTARA